MKRIVRVIASVICAFMIFSIFSIGVYAKESKAISSYEDLVNISNNLTGDYYLTNDIIAPDGNSFKTIGSSSEIFSGTLDGKGYKIANLNIVPSLSSSGTSAYAGLFGYLSGKVINLNLENVNLSTSGKNWAYAGAIAGTNQGTIENCLSSGKISNTNVEIAAYSGGICGKLLGGEVKNCISYANIYSSFGEQYTGGITGQADRGKISKCAVYGSLFSKGIDASMDAYMGGICGRSASDIEIDNCLFAGGLIAEKCSNVYLGGICGQLKGTISKSVALGSVTPSEIISHTYIGGIVSDSTSKDISDCYYLDSIVNEEITGKFGISLSKDQISAKENFDSLDFSTVWDLVDGKLILKSLPELSLDAPESKLIKIEIVSKPNKLTYIQGDSSLDLRGLKVSAVYSDKTVTLKQNEYTVGGYNYIKTGKQTITVSYKGLSTSFKITVKETSATIIGPAQITEGSYSEGNANGEIADSSQKPQSNSSGNNSSLEIDNNIPVGDNVVKDTLESENPSSETETSDNEVNKDNKKDSVDNEEKNNGLIVIIAIIIFVIIAILIFIGLFLYFFKIKKRTSTSNEMSNKEVAEVEHDPNDVY